MRHRPRGDVLLAVFLGGCLGGALRYAVTSAWPERGFPWAVWTVNVAGAFVLAAVVVVAAELVSSRYLRPLAGTGFCGALTTFSSVVVSADRLAAQHRAATAIIYLVTTIVAALAAAVLGRTAVRSVARRVGG